MIVMAHYSTRTPNTTHSKMSDHQRLEYEIAKLNRMRQRLSTGCMTLNLSRNPGARPFMYEPNRRKVAAKEFLTNVKKLSKPMAEAHPQRKKKRKQPKPIHSELGLSRHPLKVKRKVRSLHQKKCIENDFFLTINEEYNKELTMKQRVISKNKKLPGSLTQKPLKSCFRHQCCQTIQPSFKPVLNKTKSMERRKISNPSLSKQQSLMTTSNKNTYWDTGNDEGQYTLVRKPSLGNIYYSPIKKDYRVEEFESLFNTSLSENTLHGRRFRSKSLISSTNLLNQLDSLKDTSSRSPKPNRMSSADFLDCSKRKSDEACSIMSLPSASKTDLVHTHEISKLSPNCDELLKKLSHLNQSEQFLLAEDDAQRIKESNKNHELGHTELNLKLCPAKANLLSEEPIQNLTSSAKDLDKENEGHEKVTNQNVGHLEVKGLEETEPLEKEIQKDSSEEQNNDLKENGGDDKDQSSSYSEDSTENYEDLSLIAERLYKTDPDGSGTLV